MKKPYTIAGQKAHTKTGNTKMKNMITEKEREERSNFVSSMLWLFVFAVMFSPFIFALAGM